jgi:hypothetical protein
MTLGAIVAALLGLVALGFIVAPLLRAENAPAAREAAVASEHRDLLAQREMLLASLRDLEDDYATTKISDEDYESHKQQLSQQAVGVLKRLDETTTEAEEELARPQIRPVPDERKDPS